MEAPQSLYVNPLLLQPAAAQRTVFLNPLFAFKHSLPQSRSEQQTLLLNPEFLRSTKLAPQVRDTKIIPQITQAVSSFFSYTASIFGYSKTTTCDNTAPTNPPEALILPSRLVSPPPAALAPPSSLTLPTTSNASIILNPQFVFSPQVEDTESRSLRNSQLSKTSSSPRLPQPIEDLNVHAGLLMSSLNMYAGDLERIFPVPTTKLFPSEIRTHKRGLEYFPRRHIRDKTTRARLVGPFKSMGEARMMNRDPMRLTAMNRQRRFLELYRMLEDTMISFSVVLDQAKIERRFFYQGRYEHSHHESVIVTFAQRSMISNVVDQQLINVLHDWRKLRNGCLYGNQHACLDPRIESLIGQCRLIENRFRSALRAIYVATQVQQNYQVPSNVQ